MSGVATGPWMAMLVGLIAGSHLEPPVTTGEDECRPIIHISASYGDLDQLYDHEVGSPDRWIPTYYRGEPAKMSNMYPDGEIADTDNPRAPSHRYFPFALRGYPSFSPDRLISGTLRFDCYYQPDLPRGGLRFMDVPSCVIVPDAGWNIYDWLDPMMRRVGQTSGVWVAVTMDLTNGQVHAAAIDSLGSPVPGRDYGRFGTVEPKLLQGIRRTISDGELHGVLAALRLSYVSLNCVVQDDSAPMDGAMREFRVARGSGDGDIGLVSEADERAWRVAAVRHEEWRAYACEAAFEFSGLDVKDRIAFEVKLTGRATGQDGDVRIKLLNPANGNFEDWGPISLVRGEWRTARVCVPMGGPYVGADGLIRVQLESTKPIMRRSGIVTARHGVEFDCVTMRAWRRPGVAPTVSPWP